MRILYATDGSADAHAAGELLRQFGWTPEDRLTVAAVVPQGANFTGRVDPGLDECRKVVEGERYRTAEEIVRGAAREMEGSFASPETCVYTGPPAKEILDAAEEGAADLIVMGGRGRTALPDWIMGSISRAVTERARRSTLVVRPNVPPLRRVLLAYDGSGESETALEWVRRLRFPPGVEVRVGCVVEQVPLPVLSSDQVIPVEFYETAESLEAERKRRAERKAEGAAKALRAVGLEALPVVRAGRAVEEILDMAAGWPADLTVLGAHTDRDWHHDVMGNTARGLCRNLRCAVLVART